MKYRIKIVPHGKPNSEGQWIEVDAPIIPHSATHSEADVILERAIPAEYRIVAWERVR